MKISTVGAGLIALIAAPLIAQPAPPPGPPPAMTPPTRAEVSAMVERHFAEMDTNHDGVVTRAEFDAARAEHNIAFEKRFKEHRDREFAKLDSNKDGKLSQTEFDSPPPHEGGPDGKGPGGPGGMHGRMHGAGMMMGRGHWFERADADHDGKVTLAEAKTAALATFDRLDTNHDGIISPDEMQAMRMAHGHGDMPPPLQQ